MWCQKTILTQESFRAQRKQVYLRAQRKKEARENGIKIGGRMDQTISGILLGTLLGGRVLMKRVRLHRMMLIGNHIYKNIFSYIFIYTYIYT